MPTQRRSSGWWIRRGAPKTEVVAWKDHFAAGWAGYQKSYREVERAAAKVLAYQLSVVPGLLQTPG